MRLMAVCTESSGDGLDGGCSGTLYDEVGLALRTLPEFNGKLWRMKLGLLNSGASSLSGAANS